MLRICDGFVNYFLAKRLEASYGIAEEAARQRASQGKKDISREDADVTQRGLKQQQAPMAIQSIRGDLKGVEGNGHKIEVRYLRGLRGVEDVWDWVGARFPCRGIFRIEGVRRNLMEF